MVLFVLRDFRSGAIMLLLRVLQMMTYMDLSLSEGLQWTGDRTVGHDD